MERDDVFALVGEDVLTARNDHLVVTPVDEQETVRVDVAGIAGVHVTVDDGFRTSVGVARERQRSPYEDPCVRAARHVAVVAVEKPYVRAAWRAGGRPGGGRPGGRARGGAAPR